MKSQETRKAEVRGIEINITINVEEDDFITLEIEWEDQLVNNNFRWIVAAEVKAVRVASEAVGRKLSSIGGSGTIGYRSIIVI